MALLLLAFGLCAALFGAPAKAGAAPIVDTWVAPPPRVDRPTAFYHDSSRSTLGLLERVSGGRSNLWSLPDAGLRNWSPVNVSGNAPQLVARNGWAYDREHDRLLLIGVRFDHSDTCCSDNDPPDRIFLDPYEIALGSNPAWEHIEVTGDIPFAGLAFSVAFDPRRNRLLVFAGRGWVADSLRSDMFALELEGTPRWTVLHPGGPALVRENVQAWVDSLTDRLWIWGGYDSLDRRNEVRSLPLADGGVWETWAASDSLPELAFSSRGQSVAIDPERRRLLLYSGYFLSGADSAGVWQFDLDTRVGWTPLAVGGPDPRPVAGNMTALDRATGRLAIYGGYGWSGQPYDSERYDLYELPNSPGAAWTPYQITGRSGDLGEGCHVVLDRANRRAIGLDSFDESRSISVYVIGLGASQDWERVSNYEFSPVGRQYAAVAFDSVGQRTLVFGGKLGATELGDLWQMSVGPDRSPAWKRLLPEGPAPSPRWGSAVVFDPVRRRLVLFGGFAGRVVGESWALSLDGEPRWTQLETHGLPPSARSCASAVYDSRRDGMIVFGGNAMDEANPVPLQDSWFLSFADGDTWIPISAQGTAPVSRWEHAAVYDPLRDRMLVFWGRDRSSPRFDCAALELASGPVWKEYIPDGPGGASRYGHDAVYDPDLDRAVILGGRTLDSFHYSATPDWYLDFAAPAGGGPPPMSGPPFALLGMTPNPTRAGVDVAFDLPRATTVRARIYDARGRLVREFVTREYLPGRHVLVWDGVGDDGYKPRPGVYFARLVLGANEVTGKIVLLP